ncbi:glucuronate isomerase [Pontibacter sp. G13]|uniref:glucuronate isomerase n=1 Tax=Pontibacter sp. G13 TaxID=3074898 RepID=UPI00288C56D5|nr:glucuronate isomerase [Pontibacter sp. G13]WNJ20991.1 glucuronate isomerase [Pontibacter sp. G13]
MRTFIHQDFLLQSEPARRLYHEFAADLPIIDYHNHLPPAEMAANHQWDNISQVWLAGDHYKWRAMRANGIPESHITGTTPDDEKFRQWAKTVPFTLRNPLYHWTHLELSRYFGVDELLNAENADAIYAHCNAQLAQPENSAMGLLARMQVETLCTTDDPTDDLAFHQSIRLSGGDIRVLPTFRPDKALGVEDPVSYNAYLDKLSEVTGSNADHFLDLLSMLQQRLDFFHEQGCRLSDHGLEQMYAAEFSDAHINYLFHKVRLGNYLDPAEQLHFKSAVLYHLGVMYHEKGWTQQFHLGALRNNNARLQARLGADAGCDSMGDFEQAKPLSQYLNRLETEGKLAKTILYNLNPRDNDLFATMIGNFQDGSMAGKIQFGSGWWFLDQKKGMEDQLNSLSNMGLLAHFVGMLTDSRSFLSFPRHEYFRRILCNLIGEDVQQGLLPNDYGLLGDLVARISYHNAKTFFKFDEVKV